MLGLMEGRAEFLQERALAAGGRTTRFIARTPSRWPRRSISSGARFRRPCGAISWR
jgi:hypothetical protein